MDDARPHRPTDAQRKWVMEYYGMGATQGDIAKVLNIDEKTLRKHYRNELDTALINVNHQVAGALYKKAVEDRDTSAIIWWEKTRAGKGEKVDTTITHQVKTVYLEKDEVQAIDQHITDIIEHED